jgi:hypothetical protein
MRSITAVEIGADTCALASTSVRGQELYVTAAETLDPASFPGIDAYTEALERTRKTLKLPRRCRAVVWGLPDGARRRDPMVGPLVEPLTRAGFKVARVVTPCNALGALARLRTSRTGGAMCWLGINRNGVAIVVIRPGKLLYSHSFAWDSNVGASGSQARLLQRYSLVAFLAPEVRRAIAVAKQKNAAVDGIVTCGNLPDLRSLTMPLIEELDIEVETLDSLEGLQMKPDLADRLAEVAPAIRLACAGAFARESRTVDEAKRKRVRRSMRAAAVVPIAAVLAAAGGGYWWYTKGRFHTAPPAPAATSRPAPQPAPSARPPAVTPSPAPPITPPQTAPSPSPSSSTPSESGRQTAAPPVASPPSARGEAATTTATPTAPTASPAAPPAKPAAPPAPQAASSSATRQADAPRPAPGTTPPPSAATAAQPRVVPPAPSPRPAAPPPAAAVDPARPSADTPEAGSSARLPARAVPPPAPVPEVLKDPVPRFTAILVAADRRLATVGDEGQIVGVGDAIGRRVVVAIDDRTVLLKEPSGVQIRVALGGRVVGVERGGR